MCHFDGIEGFGERADLVHLHEQRICSAGFDAAGKALGVRDEQVVADELQLVAKCIGDRLPTVPVVLGQRILDRHDREVGCELRVVGRHFGSSLLAAFERVLAVLEEFGRRNVKRQRDVDAELVAGLLDRFGDVLQCSAVVRQRRRKTAFVTKAGCEAGLLQHRLQGVVALGTGAQCFLECRGTDRGDHEFLDVDAAVGMCATIEDVHHRHRQGVCVRATEVAEQRQARRIGGGLRDRERDAEDRVRTKTRLVRRSVEIDHDLVDQALLGSVEAHDLRRDLFLNRGDGEFDALAEVALATVATLGCLEGTGRCTRRHGRAGHGVVGEGDLDLDGRVAAGVEDFAGEQGFNRGHSVSKFVGPRMPRAVVKARRTEV